MSLLPSDVPQSPLTSAVRLGKRIVGFAFVPFLSLLAPFFFLPILSRIGSADVWVAVALGQSLGGVAALVASFGYPTIAPPLVSRASEAARRRLLATSIHVRLPLWAAAATVASIVAALVASDSGRAAASAMAAAMSLAALAPTWYWIGVGRAMPILWFEVLPRMAATVAATGLLLAGGSVMWYPALLAVAMAVGPAAVYWRHAGAELSTVDREDVRAVLRRHTPGMVAESSAGIYNTLAVAIVTIVAPVAAAAMYVSGDKAYRIGQYSVGSLGNAFQGWVAESRDRGLARRLAVAVTLHAAMGLAGFAAFAALGPWLTDVVFGGDVAITRTVAVGFGAAILGISLGTAFGRIGLIVIGARKPYMTCVVSSSVVGAAGLVIGGALWGASGAAAALGATELLSGVAQGVVLAVLWRRRVRAGELLASEHHDSA